MNELMIPNYSQQDFLNTTAPYEFLYEIYIEDRFIYSQVFQQMKKLAQKIKATDFSGIWKEFLKANSEDKKIENYLVFDGQEMEYKSENYLLSDDRIITFDKFGFEVEICKHPIIPIERLVNIDTQEERLKIAYKKGYNWKTIVVEKSVIASSNKIIELSAYGILVNNENAKQLSSFLLNIEQINYNELTERLSIGRFGWISDEIFSPYLDDIEFDGEASYKKIFNAVKPKGDLTAWIEIVKEFRQKNIVNKIILATSFASVLLNPLELQPFILHLWGETELGKTVALMVATSVWANPNAGEYITTFNTTAVGLEMQASFLNNLPMCLNELQIQASQGVKDFDNMIYKLCEGIGRVRGSKTGGLQSVPTWRNCIITNGERPLNNANSMGGAVNRVIDVEITEKVFDDFPKLCQIITKNYGMAGKVFVDYLKTEDGKNETKRLQKNFFEALSVGEGTSKQAISASVILTADRLINNLFFKDNETLTVIDLDGLMTKRNEVDVNIRAYEFLKDFIMINDLKFKTDGYTEAKNQEFYGDVSEGYVYIIKTIFDREFKNEGYNSTSFLSWAKRKDLILFEKGRNTKKKRIRGYDNSVNCVAIKIIDEI